MMLPFQYITFCQINQVCSLVMLYNQSMRIYFSGLGGVGIGPLAEITLDAGYGVVGSEPQPNPMTEQLENRGVTIYSEQTGQELATEHNKSPINLLVHTSAMASNHPELIAARELGIPTTKRDGLIAKIITDKQLKLIAVAGTHGKTTTTGMLIWLFRQLSLPVSYSIGATIGFGPSGLFDPDSNYFIYECDEFDRNFLHFHPDLSLITSIGYDHVDTYPTEGDYRQAFRDFLQQSQKTVLYRSDADKLYQTNNIATPETLDVLDDVNLEIDRLMRLAGAHNRRNAWLACRAFSHLTQAAPPDLDQTRLTKIVNTFPGTNRRFEKLSDSLYSDYGHHPDEIRATLQMAKEISSHVVLVYQPHQNIRQHDVREQYTDDLFKNADEVYWLPTYLSREDPNLEILSPQSLTESLDKNKLSFAEFNQELWDNIQKHLDDNHLVLCMGAGSIDGWVREQIAKS
ncbi:hypothetical protein EOM60_03585 [Candidatus Saccharibacteria bacterium]|nr:hypothetical protein [Candidatus Saccharibacteria bacterium]